MRLLLPTACLVLCAVSGYAESFAVARIPAPVLNTAAFRAVFGGKTGSALKTDGCGQVRELEYIALPGTAFTIREELRDGAATVFRVETDDYPMPAGTKLYVDSRFVEIRHQEPQSRVRRLPAVAEIVSELKASIGSSYVWGGNVRGGVGELLGFYYGGHGPAAGQRELTLSGLDCSGLLYQATRGWTPRNTSGLVTFGRAVPVTGKSVEAIARQLEPLDLIVWNGHVIIVLDHGTAIESRLECDKPGRGGVMTTPLRQRLTEIMRTRRPADVWPAGKKRMDVFVVRRWHGLQ